MRMTYSPLKPGYERKERNMIVARRGSRFKLGSFQGGREEEDAERRRGVREQRGFSDSHSVACQTSQNGR